MNFSVISSIIASNSFTLNVTVKEFAICMLTALILGVIIALVSRIGSRQSRSLSVAVVLLPVIVQTIIMLVNKEFGAGLAVAGAFSLLRFRSAPASARDLVVITLAVAVGLACGVGCVGIAIILTIVVLLLGSILLRADYGLTGFCFILLMYALRDHELLRDAIGTGALTSQWKAGLAFVPLALYNGKRGFIKGPVLKYAFYLVYPLHLLALYCIKHYVL